MKIELDNLYWYQARDVLDYCLAHSIDIDNVRYLLDIWASPLKVADSREAWCVNVPKEHVAWMALKGIL